MNRKKYVIIISSVFIIFFIFFGIFSLVVKKITDIPFPHYLCFLIYGFMGGWFTVSIITGVWLYALFIKKHNNVIKILSLVLFPITFICIFYTGILGSIPYYIFNFVKLINEIKSLSIEEKKEKQMGISELVIKYSKNKKSFIITGNIMFIIIMIVLVVKLLDHKKYFSFSLISIISFILIYFFVCYIDYINYKKIKNILVVNCDSKQYIEAMKKLLAVKQSSKLETRYSLQLILAQMLSNDSIDNANILDQECKYKMYNNLYAIVKIIYLLNEGKIIDKENVYLKNITGVNRVLVKIAIAIKKNEWIEAKEMIEYIMNNMGIDKLAAIQKVYLHYFKMKLSIENKNYDQAKYEKDYVLQNGNTLSIVKECSSIKLD